MKHLAIRLWSWWSVLVFTFWCLFFFPWMVLGFNFPSARVKRWSHRIPELISAYSMVLMGIRKRIHGEDRIDPEGKYIFISNHRSFLDILSSMSGVRYYKKYLGKKEVTSWPVIGYVTKHLYVTVDRSSPESRAKSMDDMVKAVEDGASVFIYPEGRRSMDHERPLRPFYDGAFKLAIRTQTPIAMVTSLNADELWPREGLSIRPGILHMVWTRPFETKGMTMDDLESLKESCHAEMTRLLLEWKKNGRIAL